MTVKELIEELQKYSEILDVFINEELMVPINVRETQISVVNVIALTYYDDFSEEDFERF